MQDVLVTLVVVVVAIGGVVALYSVATSGHSYREIGKGGLDVPAAGDAPSTPSPPEDRDEEIRELLQALNARRAARGEAPLDIDGEVAALPAARDDELRDELRALVEARNRRRERAGLGPLDVDAEMARRLRELN
jgi:uncharacterized protein YkwD